MTAANKKVVIIGGQAGSKIAYDIFNLMKVKVVGFMDNYVKKGNWGSIKPMLLGKVEDKKNKALLCQPDIDYFVATGDNAMREDIIRYLLDLTGQPPLNAIHPTAIISKFSRIGWGNLICAGAIINAGTEIGNGTIINTGAVIEHDNLLEDYVQISPNVALSGFVTVKKGAFVATGATVIPKITIGENAYVAAGSTVIKNVEKNTLVAGCPAVYKKKLKN